jgi:hypothetical protein
MIHPRQLRAFLAIFILVSLYMPAYNQIIKGTVTDSETQRRINFAYVYFNGTFVGTNSDKDGNFEIDISKYKSMPLTISAIGYYSVTISVVPRGKPVSVFMKPKLYELNEVVINGKAHERERKVNLKLFSDCFLGTTKNAKDCQITNTADIRFISGHDTLTAYSSNPILIDNKALGYKITYFLDEFIYDEKNESFLFVGNIIFNEDLSAEEEQKQIFDARREKAYLGSRMHFFRSLWNNELDSTKFNVKNSAGETLPYDSLVIHENRTKYLSYPEDIGICFRSALPTSYILFVEESVNFDSNGYFDPSSVSWQGEMSRKRIADWLPYEYETK